MIRNWMIYLAVVVATGVFSIMYIKQSGFILFLIALIVPVLYSGIAMFVGREKVFGAFVRGDLQMKKDKETKLTVMIRNDSGMNEGAQADLWIRMSQGFDNRSEVKKIRVILQRGAQEISLPYTPRHSGINEIVLEKIKVRNGFSLFFFSVEPKERISFLIMPEYRDFAIESKAIYVENEGESQKYSSQKAGNDPSELFDLRDYQPGDRMNRINWKLTAKNQSLYVKDYGFSIACDMAIFFDIEGIEDSEEREQAVEALYFLVVKFVLAEKYFYVVWKDSAEAGVKRKMMTSDEDIFPLFSELFQSQSGDTEPIEDLYHAKFEGEFLSDSIFITREERRQEEELLRMKLPTNSIEFVTRRNYSEKSSDDFADRAYGL